MLFLSATNGPFSIPNSTIADQAETHASRYQSEWRSQWAAPLASLADAQRGDIAQWGGGAPGGSGAGRSLLHTAYVHETYTFPVPSTVSLTTSRAKVTDNQERITQLP